MSYMCSVFVRRRLKNRSSHLSYDAANLLEDKKTKEIKDTEVQRKQAKMSLVFMATFHNSSIMCNLRGRD